ncbi:MAG: DNA alkylation repair protein [Clostridia bacterium]|nr:DNA alkylation repair protein [Clostridia bacterium]
MKFNTNEELKNHLLSIAKEGLKDFSEKIIPAGSKIYGVTVPELRRLAKEAAKDDFYGFLSVLSQDSFEEILLYGMAIGYADIDYDERVKLIRTYASMADNWAHVDCAAATYKFINKNKRAFLREIEGFLSSDKEFVVRMGFVLLLDYYVDEEYLPFIFAAAENADCSPYYVSMAVAWLLSVCAVKFREETLAYLAGTKIDDKTYNRTVRKITDSYRVDEQTKNMLKKTLRK